MSPLRSTLDFLMYDWLQAEQLASRAFYADHSRETFDAVMDTCERIAREKFAPFNRTVDMQEPAFDGGKVILPACTYEARKAYADSGMLSAAQPYAHGGMQLPYVVEAAANSFFACASISIGSNLLTVGNANLLRVHGTPMQQQVFADNEFNGRWAGTMALSEPQAGSSLSDICTRAEPDGDDFANDPLGPRYRLKGNKMWISSGDHELTENIVHLVLAKIPGPDGKLIPGVKGISLFIVPKQLVDTEGQLTGERNDVALAGLNHPDGVLRPDDFVAIKANWDPKDLNLKAIASELNLGADSFVFADDNPAERAIVAAQVPGVAVPALDGAENYIKTLDHGGYFEVTALSKEDLKKTELYHQNAERAKAQAAFADYGQYLDSLEMTATIKGFEPLYIQRIAQLTNKSNQFNLTTLRCSEDDIRAMAGDKNDLCLCGKLVDKFGDNGIVTVVAGRQQGDVLDLTLWLMSCRVLKRGMEDAMMDTVVAEAAAREVKTIVGHYYPTAKNAMVREFYAQYDFAKTAEDADGNTEWTLDVAAYTPKHPHMKIER